MLKYYATMLWFGTVKDWVPFAEVNGGHTIHFQHQLILLVFHNLIMASSPTNHSHGGLAGVTEDILCTQ